MQTGNNKVTLTLDRELLEKMAQRVQKTRSAFVRDLIRREADLIEEQPTISQEILELKGSLAQSSDRTKSRVYQAANRKLRRHEGT